jgi:hypothetical protein
MAMKKKKKKTKTTDHTVTITEGSGTLTYSTKKKKVKSGDRLRWTCNRAYAIQFASNDSPFYPNTPYLSQKANVPTAFGTIKNSTVILTLKYSVAAYVGGSHPIVTDDPQVIIDNSGGIGGKEPGKTKPAGKKSTKKKAAKK